MVRYQSVIEGVEAKETLTDLEFLGQLRPGFKGDLGYPSFGRFGCCYGYLGLSGPVGLLFKKLEVPFGINVGIGLRNPVVMCRVELKRSFS